MRKTSDSLNPFVKSKDLRLFILVAGIVTVVGVPGAVWLNQKSGTSVARQAIIQVTADGFVPATLAVRAGTVVVWKNSDAAPHAVASNPYPQNSSVPGLRSQTILPNGSYTYVPASSGTIQYHDDTQPTRGGTIVVAK